MPRVFGVKHGAIGLPPWVRVVRAMQLLFALFVIGLAGYALRAHSKSPVRHALILSLVTAVLTVFPIFLFTLPLPGPKAVVHPLGTLASDFLGVLLWLASLSSLASYLREYSYYRKINFPYYGPGAPNIKAAWKSGVAACVFAALEFLLFLITVKLFAYYYHHHRAGTEPAGSLFKSTTFGAAPSASTRHDEAIAMQDTEADRPPTSSAAPAATPTPSFPTRAPNPPYPAASDGPSPPVSPLQTAPASRQHQHDPIPAITTTTAAPTVAHFGQAHQDPMVPGVHPRVAAAGAATGGDPGGRPRPPYPLDQDELRGAKGSNGAGGPVAGQ